MPGKTLADRLQDLGERLDVFRLREQERARLGCSGDTKAHASESEDEGENPTHRSGLYLAIHERGVNTALGCA